MTKSVAAFAVGGRAVSPQQTAPGKMLWPVPAILSGLDTVDLKEADWPGAGWGGRRDLEFWVTCAGCADDVSEDQQCRQVATVGIP